MDQNQLEAKLSHWGQPKIIHPLTGGYRNEAWLVEIEGQPSVAKTTRRSESALQWLLNVHNAAHASGFAVPRLLPTKTGTLNIGGLTLEAYLNGRAATPEELDELAEPMARFHAATRHIPQRPDFASSTQLLDQDAGGDVDFSSMPRPLVAACRDAWRILATKPQSVVHGDLNCANVLISPEGPPALIDWDESRVDASIFDTLALQRAGQHPPEEKRALLAWEIAVCWHVEHDYAQALALEFLSR